MRRFVLHHADSDGYGAAFAAWTSFQEAATYVPVNYGYEFPIKDLQADDVVYCLDFAGFDLDDISKRCNLIVIDHHDTAIKKYGDRPWFIGRNGSAGCVLAWRHFCPEVEVPEILLLIEAWDLWRTPFSVRVKAIHVLMETYKSAFWMWTDMVTHGVDAHISEAMAMYKYHCHAVDEMTKHAWVTTFCGYKAVMVQAPYPFISDSAQVLLDAHPEAEIAVIPVINEKMITYSLRSREGSGIHVGELAAKFGGGGHAPSAGFRVPAEGVWKV
jgi:oligoribonuclease NrnB/cAMP/cGMP phosphodiesterase (DHH superfamily)